MATDYGTTFAFMTMDNRLSLLGGIDCVADDLIGRLSMKLWYNTYFGTIIENLINASTNKPQKAILDISNAVTQELMKDERVRKVSSKVTRNSSTLASINVELTFDVTLRDSETFTLIGNINSLDTTKWSWL